MSWAISSSAPLHSSIWRLYRAGGGQDPCSVRTEELRLLRKRVPEIYRRIPEDSRGESHIEYAIDKVRRECDQGWQGIEYKLNTVGSSRGDYPFVTVTLGLGTSMFEKMISISLPRGPQKRTGQERPQKAGALPENRLL